MNTIKFPPKKDWSQLLKRPTQSYDDLEQTVKSIFKDIESHRDEAIEKYTEMFDGVKISNIIVSSKEFEDASNSVAVGLKEAIKLAYNNIYKFHEAQKINNLAKVETQPGVTCWQSKKPIDSVGLYIPGGSAPLFSSILMLAIPAKIAGCKTITLATPPRKDGTIDPAILYTAHLCGIETVVKVGGIQAIAGLTFGTKSIPKAYKIFGPGNQYVTVAKQVATTYDVAIDMPAGPSELLVMADETAKPSFVASDLLSQAEHGADSQVILVSTDNTLIEAVKSEIKSQIEQLPRVEIAKAAISNSKFILVDSFTEAAELINNYAPEHFIVATRDNNFFVDHISNAGSVFIGNFTPESAGDYASGTNHTLPTNAYAKQYSGVNLDAFMKTITYQEISQEGIKHIGAAVELMAEAEGLTAHKNAMSKRLEAIKESDEA
ncbi:histidinol dehydrogenase [Psychroflexus sp. ALD_RP9]|uniref:histidinol dehydrogenase n=1 Tax=Psychroflexus sp. ALD_RP9 TaxID=2777186 RepID=UPI001A8D8F3E|nr:histidinol dehydrogenase [Psychroflexus sp. ALD_RP9]QSS97083.1 histidinol dehydrogenase [Psychroflexus sp. ALD_RP9]